MARLDARLPADEAQAIWQALTAEADRLGHDDPRTFDQRRADVLASWAHSVLDDPSLPRRHGRSPRLQVTVGLATLLGLRDNPGELAGHGPIDAWLARELAADAEWELFITDPGTGALVAKGSRRYRPSQALRDFLLGREPECSFPGCPIPSERCDIDHAVPYDEGGDTDERNCGPPCRRHHRAKTFGGFVLERHPDGSVTWITPSGVARTEPPVRLAGDD